jgi:hypothetical protein
MVICSRWGRVVMYLNPWKETRSADGNTREMKRMKESGT